MTMRKNRKLHMSAAAVLTALLLVYSCCVTSDAFSAAYQSLQRAYYFCVQGESALPYSNNPRAAFENSHSLHALPPSGASCQQLSPLSEAYNAEAAKIFHFDCLLAKIPDTTLPLTAGFTVPAGKCEFTPFFYVKTTHKLE